MSEWLEDGRKQGGGGEKQVRAAEEEAEGTSWQAGRREKRTPEAKEQASIMSGNKNTTFCK